MRIRSLFTAFAASYFVLVFLRDGTATKLIKDASKGAQDLASGLKGPARLA